MQPFLMFAYAGGCALPTEMHPFSEANGLHALSTFSVIVCCAIRGAATVVGDGSCIGITMVSVSKKMGITISINSARRDTRRADLPGIPEPEPGPHVRVWASLKSAAIMTSPQIDSLYKQYHGYSVITTEINTIAHRVR